MVVVDLHVAAGVERLVPTIVPAVRGDLDVDRLEAGPARVLIPVDHADDLHVVLRVLAADLDLDRLTGACAEPIRVTDDPHPSASPTITEMSPSPSGPHDRLQHLTAPQRVERLVEAGQADLE